MSRTSRSRVGNFVSIWILLTIGYEVIEGLPWGLCFHNKRLGLELDPTNGRYTLRGAAYESKGDKAKAQADYAKAKELGY